MDPITMPQQSAAILKVLLEQPGYTPTTSLLWLAGDLLVNVLPECGLTDEPSRDDFDRHTAWCESSIVLMLPSNDHRSVCVSAIEAAVKGGALSPSLYTYRLLDAFGLHAKVH